MTITRDNDQYQIRDEAGCIVITFNEYLDAVAALRRMLRWQST